MNGGDVISDEGEGCFTADDDKGTSYIFKIHSAFTDSRRTLEFFVRCNNFVVRFRSSISNRNSIR